MSSFLKSVVNTPIENNYFKTGTGRSPDHLTERRVSEQPSVFYATTQFSYYENKDKGILCRSPNLRLLKAIINIG